MSWPPTLKYIPYSNLKIWLSFINLQFYKLVTIWKILQGIKKKKAPKFYHQEKNPYFDVLPLTNMCVGICNILRELGP